MGDAMSGAEKLKLRAPKIVAPVRWHLRLTVIAAGMIAYSGSAVAIWSTFFRDVKLGDWVALAVGPFFLSFPVFLVGSSFRGRVLVENAQGPTLSRVHHARAWLSSSDVGATVAADFVILRRWRWRSALHSLSGKVALGSEASQVQFYTDNRGRSFGDVRLVADLLDPIAPQTLLACDGASLYIAIHGGPTDQAAFEVACRTLARALERLVAQQGDGPAMADSLTSTRELGDLLQRFRIDAGPYSSALADFERVREIWANEDDFLARARPLQAAPTYRQAQVVRPPSRPRARRHSGRAPRPIRWHAPVKILAVTLLCVSVLAMMRGAKQHRTKSTETRTLESWVVLAPVLGLFAGCGLLVASEMLQRIHMIPRGNIRSRKWLSRIHHLSVDLVGDDRAEIAVLRRWDWRKSLHTTYSCVRVPDSDGLPTLHVDNRGVSCGDAAGLVADLLVGVRAPRRGYLREPHTLIASTGTSVLVAIHGGMTDRAEVDRACTMLEETLHRMRALGGGHFARPPSTAERVELERLEHRLRPPVAVGEAGDELESFLATRRMWDAADGARRRSQSRAGRVKQGMSTGGSPRPKSGTGSHRQAGR